jgi:hypothetical protein
MRLPRLALGLLLLGCAPAVQMNQRHVSAAREWPTTVVSAQNAVAGGRYADAERMLANFARRYPGALEARETYYWRALFLLDPANHNQDASAAVRDLDAYLADGSTAPHRAEAQTLRRIAIVLDSLDRSAELAASTTDTLSTPSPEMLARMHQLQTENQRLKAQLEKNTKELERIKKRLAAPKPDGE